MLLCIAVCVCVCLRDPLLKLAEGPLVSHQGTAAPIRVEDRAGIPFRESIEKTNQVAITSSSPNSILGFSYSSIYRGKSLVACGLEVSHICFFCGGARLARVGPHTLLAELVWLHLSCHGWPRPRPAYAVLLGLVRGSPSEAGTRYASRVVAVLFAFTVMSGLHVCLVLLLVINHYVTRRGHHSLLVAKGPVAGC